MKRHSLTVILFMLWLPGLALGQMSGFLRLDGATGESQDTNHVGWMDVSTAEVGNLINTSTSATGNQGPLFFYKNVDSASTALNLDCVQGAKIRSGTLEYTATNTSIQFFRLNLTNIVISNINVIGQAGGESRPQEVIYLEAQIISWNYVQSGATSGLPVDYFASQWDFAHRTGTNNVNAPVFMMSGIRQVGGAQLSWQATAGKRYCIYAVTQLGQPFTPMTVVTAATTGIMTSLQPIIGQAMFFIVEELP